MIAVKVGDDDDILLLRQHGVISAFSNTCTHDEVPLSIGWLDPVGRIICAMHHAEYDTRTGLHLAGPGSQPLRRYLVREFQGWLEIDLAVDPGSQGQSTNSPVFLSNRKEFLERLRKLNLEYQADKPKKDT